MGNRQLAAIDLGSTKVACVIGQVTGADSGFEILGCGMANYPTMDAMWPIEPALIARTIEQALEETKVAQPPGRALVGLTHPELSHRQVAAQIDMCDEPATIRSRELERLRAQALGQALSIDRDVLLLGSLGYAGNGFEGVHDPRGLAATRLSGTFQLISIPLALRRAVTQALESVGLEIEQLFYSLQAIAACCVDDEAALKRILLIDIGGCCTDLGVLDRGYLARSLTIPWGGMLLAEAIARGCRMTMTQALAVSFEGLASPKPKVRALTEQQLRHLRRGIHQIVTGGPLPDLAIVTGRGSLMDGLVEWVETITEIKAVLGRSPRASHLGDLNRQVALSAALGLLELACKTRRVYESSPRGTIQGLSRRSRLLDQLLSRTKQILVDYF